MSKTLVDMPKVTQMLDAGWCVELFKNNLGSYTAIANHAAAEMMERYPAIVDADGDIVTDDFTPEQALTRLAYKVHGEILSSIGEEPKR